MVVPVWKARESHAHSDGIESRLQISIAYRFQTQQEKERISKATGKWMQQLPTLLECYELLHLFAKLKKLCATTPNNMQQGMQMTAIQQFWELLANNVASICTELKQTRMSNLHQRDTQSMVR